MMDKRDGRLVRIEMGLKVQAKIAVVLILLFFSLAFDVTTIIK